MFEQSVFARRMAAMQPSFIREILKAAENPAVISFAGGLPNADFFPSQALANIAADLLLNRASDVLQYGQTQGEFELREFIAENYRTQHGLEISPDDILITNGSQQGFDLIGKVLIDGGDTVVIESPAYLGATQALALYQPKFIPVPINSTGMELNDFERAVSASPKLVYTVPNFQNPTGYSYSTATREAMAAVLRQTKSLLIEDDPYGALRFAGKVTPSFYHYLPEQTLLLGSFSKTVVPGLRLGWMVAPQAIMQKLIIAKQAADLHSSRLSQHVTLSFIRSGEYPTHLRTVIDAYRQRSEQMGAKLDDLFGEEIQRSHPEGGMFMWVQFLQHIDSTALFRKASELGVVFVPGQPFYTELASQNCARLNYSCSSVQQISQGLELLHQAYRQL